MASILKQLKHPEPAPSFSSSTWLIRRWRQPRLILALIIFEILPTIAALALYGIADPDLYRTRLWRDGSLNGFNSSPDSLILSYTNHTVYKVPLVWSQYITTFNLVISVLSMFILLVKSLLFVLGIFIPLLSAAVHAGLTGVYLFSFYAQMSGDMSDPSHPQPGPAWYITKSCDVAYDKGDVGYCRQAKGCLAVAFVLAILFFTHTVLAVISSVPDEKKSGEETLEQGFEVKDGVRFAMAERPVQGKAGFVEAHPLRLNESESGDGVVGTAR